VPAWRITRSHAAVWLAPFLLATLGGPPCRGQSDQGEAQVRAALILNLTRFTEWPTSRTPDPQSPLTLCFMGKDPVRAEMETLLAAQKNPDRPRIVKRIGDLSEAGGCHVLFLGAGQEKKLGDARALLAKDAVLTISEDAKSGTVLQLPLVDDRVRILVDLPLALQSGLKLSSRLLQVAVVTR
jgi:hypothetical protein